MLSRVSCAAFSDCGRFWNKRNKLHVARGGLKMRTGGAPKTSHYISTCSDVKVFAASENRERLFDTAIIMLKPLPRVDLSVLRNVFAAQKIVFDRPRVFCYIALLKYVPTIYPR